MIAKQETKQPASGKSRQATYAQKQKASGRSQRSYWLDETETKKVAEFIEKIRAERDSRENFTATLDTASVIT